MANKIGRKIVCIVQRTKTYNVLNVLVEMTLKPSQRECAQKLSEIQSCNIFDLCLILCSPLLPWAQASGNSKNE